MRMANRIIGIRKNADNADNAGNGNADSKTADRALTEQQAGASSNSADNLASSALLLYSATVSDVGYVRSNNQDSTFAGERIIAVCDGMGGHAGGDTASTIAIRSLAHIERPGQNTEVENIAHTMGTSVLAAHDAIVGKAKRERKLHGMGTTVTAVTLTGSHWVLAHIGDSRAYLLRDGQLIPASKDHSYVQHLIDTGRISEEEAKHHPQRNVVMRVLGDFDIDPHPDISVRSAQSGDRWLLCSDGLCGVLSDDTIREQLAGIPNRQECVQVLVSMALKAGSTDNVSAVIADAIAPENPDKIEPHHQVPLVGGAASANLEPIADIVDEAVAAAPVLKETDSPAERAAALKSRIKGEEAPVAGSEAKGAGETGTAETNTEEPGEEAASEGTADTSKEDTGETITGEKSPNQNSLAQIGLNSDSVSKDGSNGNLDDSATSKVPEFVQTPAVPPVPVFPSASGADGSTENNSAAQDLSIPPAPNFSDAVSNVPPAQNETNPDANADAKPSSDSAAATANPDTDSNSAAQDSASQDSNAQASAARDSASQAGESSQTDLQRIAFPSSDRAKKEGADAVANTGEIPVVKLKNGEKTSDPANPAVKKAILHEKKNKEKSQKRTKHAIIAYTIAAVAAVLALAGFFSYRWTQTQYYIGDSDGKVTIFQGVHTDVFGMQLSHEIKKTDISIDDLPESWQKKVAKGIVVNNVSEAESRIEIIKNEIELNDSQSSSSQPSSSSAAGANLSESAIAGGGR